jgi:hypothetical protein
VSSFYLLSAKYEPQVLETYSPSWMDWLQYMCACLCLCLKKYLRHAGLNARNETGSKFNNASAHGYMTMVSTK